MATTISLYPNSYETSGRRTPKIPIGTYSNGISAFGSVTQIRAKLPGTNETESAIQRWADFEAAKDGFFVIRAETLATESIYQTALSDYSAVSDDDDYG